MDFYTGFTNNNHYATFLIFGCGVVLVKSGQAMEIVRRMGFKKVRIFNGTGVGFSLFGVEV